MMSDSTTDIIKGIFWIIIFFIWIFSRILKKIPQKKGDPGQKNVRQIKENVGDFFKELSEKMKEGESKAEAVSKPLITVTASENTLPPPIPQDKTKPVKAYPTEKMTPDSSSRQVRECSPPCNLSQINLAFRKNLRQAIIFSEILAPPLALRNDEEITQR